MVGSESMVCRDILSEGMAKDINGQSVMAVKDAACRSMLSRVMVC